MVSLPPLDGALLENTLVASRYRVLFELGRGGTARVYLAVMEGPNGFNKLVVLKVLKSQLARDPEFHTLFFNEARLSSRLSHANVVQVLEVLEHAGAPAIAMEYLAGKSLYEVRQRAPRLLGLDTQLHILTQVLAGLHYSHELTDFDGTPLDVVHRDLTPQNVFLTFDGQVKILDFGIAKVAGSLVETRVGTVKGKVRYMPPEQLDGRGVDRRADIFACGVILWEAIAGRRLWQDMTDVAVVSAVLDGAVPSLRDAVPDVDSALEAICSRALARHPAERYRTAEAFQIALEEYLSHSTRVTSRELSRALTETFSAEREQVARAIEERLGYASLLRNSPPPRAPSTNPPSPRRSVPGKLSQSAPPKPRRGPSSGSEGPVGFSDEVVFSVVQSARGERAWVFWLTLFCAIGVGGYLLFWRPTP